MKNFLAIAAILMSGSVIAMPMAETGDAGELPGSAQMVNAGTTSITGMIDFDADMFVFEWGGGAITIDTIGSSIDTQLFLFDSSGVGVWANDDGLGLMNLQSLINDPMLAAGIYYIGVSAFDYDPQVAGVDIFPDFPSSDTFSPSITAPLDGWGAGDAGTDAGSYVINFSSPVEPPTVIPVPATLLLFSAGLVLLRLNRR